MRARAHERFAWLLLLVASLPWLYGPLINLAQGEPIASGMQFWENDPANASATSWADLVAQRPDGAAAVAGYNRMASVFGLAYGLLLVTVICTAYRRGERWAWFAAWTYPGALIGFITVATVHHGWGVATAPWGALSLEILIGVILLGLLLPVRIFLGHARPRDGVA